VNPAELLSDRAHQGVGADRLMARERDHGELPRATAASLDERGVGSTRRAEEGDTGSETETPGKAPFAGSRCRKNAL
jgi:hypothetical protein